VSSTGISCAAVGRSRRSSSSRTAVRSAAYCSSRSANTTAVSLHGQRLVSFPLTFPRLASFALRLGFTVNWSTGRARKPLWGLRSHRGSESLPSELRCEDRCALPGIRPVVTRRFEKLPTRQAGGHWFEPSTVHLRKPALQRGFRVFVVVEQVALGSRGARGQAKVKHFSKRIGVADGTALHIRCLALTMHMRQVRRTSRDEVRMLDSRGEGSDGGTENDPESVRGAGFPDPAISARLFVGGAAVG